MAIVGLAAGPAAAATFAVLYSFTGGSDGANPGGPLLLDAGGNLYGTASSGAGGNGVVFQLAAPGLPGQSLNVLYTFPALPTNMVPNGGLAFGAQGALYGSAYQSQTGFDFRLAPPSAPDAPWRFEKLASFPGIDSRRGGGPTGVPSVDRAGNVFGVTQAGGSQTGRYPCQCGVAYELPAARSPRTEHVLYTFTSLPGGNVPVAGLTRAAPDLFYGTTWLGGTGQCLDGSDVVVVGCGTVFQLSKSADAWTETTLYSFRLNEGNQPVDPVVLGPDGDLYGVAVLDVYRLHRKNGVWHKRTLYSFPGGIGGTAPTGGPVFDAAGNMYGATRSFGIDGPATVFELSPSPDADAPWTPTTLATLPGGYGAGQPWGGVTRAPDGTLYGAASIGIGNGYIFSVVP